MKDKFRKHIEAVGKISKTFHRIVGQAVVSWKTIVRFFKIPTAFIKESIKRRKDMINDVYVPINKSRQYVGS